ncbi:MAG: MATE family efflux transporter [Eubacteriales bacterium]
MIKEKAFYKTVLGLAFPFILQNALNLFLNLLDTIMLGSLDTGAEAAISAASLAGKPFFFFTLLMFGITSGSCVLISQYWGKGDTRTINSITGLAQIIACSFGLVFSILLFLFAHPVMSMFSNSPAVVELSVKYLTIVVFSYVPMAITGVFTGVLKAVENVRVPLYAAGIAILINLFFNWCLIFGNLGFPAMGVAGSAIGTLIARLAELGIVLTYLRFGEKRLRLSLKGLFRIKKWMVSDFFRYSLPVMLNEGAWGLGITIHAMILGNLGEVQYAAYSVATVVEQLATLSAFGLAAATGIIVGKTIGEGKKDVVYDYGKTMLVLSCGIAIIMAGIVFALRYPLLQIFNVQPETKDFAYKILIVIAAAVVFKTFNCVVIVGVLRGGGDTTVSLLIDFLPMYIISIPLGIVAFKLGAPVHIVLACLMSDEGIKWIFSLARFFSRKWIKNITREDEVPLAAAVLPEIAE